MPNYEVVDTSMVTYLWCTNRYLIFNSSQVWRDLILFCDIRIIIHYCIHFVHYLFIIDQAMYSTEIISHVIIMRTMFITV
jgi:hypothetical protein